jgi:ABC-type nickel/cobalt efflux system permease component RcnA
MKNLRRLWHGELALRDAFWNWAVLGGLVINVVCGALFLFLIMEDRPVSALMVGYAIPVPYNAIALVGVWRSAGRYTGERRLARRARIVTVIGMVLLSIL